MIIDPISWLLAVAGGVIIGLASLALLFFNGRITGVSGIAAGLLGRSGGDRLWRGLFVLGMIAAGGVFLLLHPPALPQSTDFGLGMGAIAAAGVLVGVGSRMASGCTSGHGVCGMSRLSPRSFAATATFVLAGAIGAGALRYVLGGA